jgi:lincosamide nucleotidyltransferase A/C/D/E
MDGGEITQRDAIELIDRFEAAGIEIVVDGGWGVDALLGRQTRPHLDLDIALPAAAGPQIRTLLSDMRFEQIPTVDTWEHNWVVQDLDLRRVDIHTYVLDSFGRNGGGVAYHAHHLTGHGIIGRRAVRCIPVDVLIEFHLGYEQDEGDFLDVLAFCEAFGRTLPSELEHFRPRQENQAD